MRKCGQRLKKVVMGGTFSPFLRLTVMLYHLMQYENVPTLAETVKTLKEDFYMDDFMSGRDSVDDTCQLIRDGKSIMGDAGLSFSKVCSNSSEVGEILSVELGSQWLGAEIFKTLGLLWKASIDCFTFKVDVDLPDNVEVTMRIVLSIFHKLLHLQD